MNERIKELSDIAYKNHLVRNPNSSFGRRTDYDREFAELIVRECARALDDKLANPNGASMAYCDGSDLLEHFGVEE